MTHDHTHTTLYRKYRPSVFEEVIGQERTVRILKAALKNNTAGHAYLFYGGRGTGKTSLARIFARELGVHPEDMYEIDAASHTGVDNIRELNESTTSLPFRSPYKVYIIDEVHMLSKNAFNALLKTIEEPPRHVIFMLATTEIEKVIDTIVSRCQVLTLDQPTIETLRELIKKVGDAEGLTLSPTAMTTIALLGDGSFRDTLGVLQKVMTTTASKTLSDEEVEAITGAPNLATLQDILTAIAAGDVESGLSSISKARMAQVSATLLVSQLLHYGRSLLLLRFAPNQKNSIQEDVGKDMMVFLEGLAATGVHLNAAWLAKLIDTHHATKRSHLPFLPLELAILSHLEKVVHK